MSAPFLSGKLQKATGFSSSSSFSLRGLFGGGFIWFWLFFFFSFFSPTVHRKLFLLQFSSRLEGVYWLLLFCIINLVYTPGLPACHGLGFSCGRKHLHLLWLHRNKDASVSLHHHHEDSEVLLEHRGPGSFLSEMERVRDRLQELSFLQYRDKWSKAGHIYQFCLPEKKRMARIRPRACCSWAIWQPQNMLEAASRLATETCLFSLFS